LDERDVDALVESIDRAHARAGAEQLALLRLLAEADRAKVFEVHGARDTAHWISMWLGVSWRKADRWLACALALDGLPVISRALESGELSLDKVVELTRFATAEDEDELIRWARVRSSGAIRRRGDLARRSSMTEAAEITANRALSWWFTEDGRQMALEAWLPAAEGALVARTIDRLAEAIPPMPGEEGPWAIDQRRADALVALASSRLGSDGDLVRPTMVIHATAASLAADDASCEIEAGGVVHAATARRLACTARVQAQLDDPSGTPIRLGRMRREPSAWMVRQVRHRDRGCTFPGCGHRRFVEAHHIVWWERGGRTDLENLTLICTFHHRLVHEHGWSIEHEAVDGAIGWLRPDGTRYHAGPAPPDEVVA
jgi:hypothetical protein